MEINFNGNKEKLEMESYLAHVQYESQRTQRMEEHLKNTAEFSGEICPLDELRTIAELTMLFHDAGKLSDEIQEDYRRILELGEDAHKHNMDHSTAGGRIVYEMAEDKKLARFISTAIYSHHGVRDCINMETGKTLKEERDEKKIEYDVIRERFWRIYDKEQIKEKFRKASGDYEKIRERILSFLSEYTAENVKCGNIWFYLGLYQRLLLSVVIDSDWTDTACFSENIPLPIRMCREEIAKIWNISLDYFENYLAEQVGNNPDNGIALREVRQEISNLCKEAAYQSQNLYRLTVPTGAGKTLSSLRFALHRAKKENKQHIIYIAPFNSILEQNAQEIRMALGNSDIVLEHHCNVVCDTEEEEQKYQKMTEIWDEPVIVTTAVQILNTLFSARKSCIRRFHSICNSVIIFDEVQAIPVKCTELFYLAVNFLTNFCNTTVVLCSATQPSLSKLEENNICKCVEMAGNWNDYAAKFKRYEIMDTAKDYPGGMKLSQLAEFTEDTLEKYNSVLVVVNTIKCALNLYKKLKDDVQDNCRLFHLSNNMCAQNKIEKLAEIRKSLREGQKIICVATPLVEAGVNFSFGCVIRSMSGLDNILQAAGRCARHKEFDFLGAVYIVHLTAETESLNHLPEIDLKQKALLKVLDISENDKERYSNSLDSQLAVKDYYKKFYQLLDSNITKFPSKGYQESLVGFLGKNEIGRAQYKRLHCGREFKASMGQAFQTAGEQFEVISEDYKINIVVPYDAEACTAIEKLENEYLNSAETKRVLQKLQRYTVGISEKKRKDLNNAVYSIGDGEVLVLNEGYYSRDIGVLEEPAMEFCGF